MGYTGREICNTIVMEQFRPSSVASGGESTQDQRDRTEEHRALSQAELLKGGAVYEAGVLKVTPEQRQRAEREMREDLFKNSPDYHNLHASEIEMSTLLGELFTRYKGGAQAIYAVDTEDYFDKIKSQDRQFETILNKMDIPYPNNQEEGKALYERVQLENRRVRETMELLANHPGLRTGAEVNVRRSSGEMEAGWMIEAVRPNGTARVVQEEKQLTKHVVPLVSIAEWNERG